jgi:hypothetical protein
MNTKPSYVPGLAVSLTFLLLIPADTWATPQAAGQRAGEVSRVIPAVSIARSSKTITASAKTVVDWQDLVNTLTNARARIALDDGSVLNVGSESSMKVVKHDPAAQQSELELTYGKLRTQVQKIAKPDGKFEVRTPAGVAGVVGTDFYMEFANSMMNVVVFEGLVRVCNLAGVCVIVKAGQFTNVRTGDNSAPLSPAPATLAALTAAVQDTDVSGGIGPTIAGAGPHLGKGLAITLGIVAAVPAVIFPIIATHRGAALPTAVPKCPPNTPTCG